MSSTEQVTTSDLEDFLRQTASRLGVSGSIGEFGVTRILSVVLSERVVEVCTNGAMLWLIADLDWPSFPTDGTCVTWAPEQSYLRIKLLEVSEPRRTTGVAEFDSAYLVHGPSAKELSLDPRLIRVLLANQELRPSLHGQTLSQEPVELRQRRHVECRPDLSEGDYRPGGVQFGTERLQPRYAARWASEAAHLAAAVERST